MSNKGLNTLLSYAFLVVFFLPADTNAAFAAVNPVLNPIKYLGFAWSILIFIGCGYCRRRELVPVWAFLALGGVSTAINGTSMAIFIRFAYPIFACCVLTWHLVALLREKGAVMIALLYPLTLAAQGLSALTHCFGTVVDGNCIEYANYYLGQRVSISRVLVYALAVCMLLARRGGKAVRLLCLFAVLSAVGFALYESVSTAIMTLLTFFACFAAARVIRSMRFWRLSCVAAFVFVATFAFLESASDGFKALLVDFLGEDTTLNGRTFLWAQAVENIRGWHWLAGNGYGHGYLFQIGDWAVGHPHNQYLELIFCFGAAGLAGFFALWYRQLSAAGRTTDLFLGQTIVAVSMAIVVTGLPTATYQSVYMYIFYVLTLLVVRKEGQGAEEAGAPVRLAPCAAGAGC